MATSTVLLSLNSEANADQVIMCLKDGMRSNRHIRPVYQPIKAAVRNREAFWTQAEDEEAEREAKYERKRNALGYGFFTEKTQPFQPVGTVHLDDGDLILSALTDEIKARMIDLPKLKKDSLEKTRKIRLMNRRPTPTPPPSTLGSVKPSAGISAIKQRIGEIVEMKKLVLGKQPLSNYLTKKEAEMNKTKEPADSGVMLAPPAQNWALVADTLGEIASLEKRKNDDASLAAKAVLYFQEIADQKKCKELLEGKQQNAGSDVDNYEENWRKQKRLNFVKEKLKAINSLLCAVFNMRSKFIKSITPLPHKLAANLLRTDIIFDEYGKPTGNWKSYAVLLSAEGGRTSETASDTSYPSTQMINDLELSRNARHKLASTAARTNAFMAAHLSSKNLDSMDDFSTWTPVRSVHMVPVPPANSKVIKSRRKTTIFPITLDSTPPWMTIPQTEKTIHDKKTLVFGKKQLKRRRAVEILHDLKEDFNKLQMNMDRHVQEEFKKEKLNQLKKMRYKFNAICVGPPAYEALNKMREVANTKIKNRMDSTMQPMKWFLDLRTEVALEVGEQPCPEVELLLDKVARFQYDDDRSIPFAKEKLCLLVMSIPAYILLTGPMVHGLTYLVKMFGLPQEILQYWLSGRKFDEISNMQKRIYI